MTGFARRNITTVRQGTGGGREEERGARGRRTRTGARWRRNCSRRRVRVGCFHCGVARRRGFDGGRGARPNLFHGGVPFHQFLPRAGWMMRNPSGAAGRRARVRDRLLAAAGRGLMERKGIGTTDGMERLAARPIKRAAAGSGGRERARPEGPAGAVAPWPSRASRHGRGRLAGL